MSFTRTVLLWFPMLAIAILNGAVRDGTYGKRLPELRAHQLGSLIGCCLFGLYIWASKDWLNAQNALQAWIAGMIWLLMTVIFEFVFGRLVGKHSWSRLFNDYNIFAGRLWLLVLLTVSLGPWLTFSFR